MSIVTIAPHLERALERMSKDTAVEPQALVNQAVFAWLRINGYVLPAAPLAAPPPAVEPERPAVALGAALPLPESSHSSPSGEPLAVMARMNAIAADAEKLTKPWPAWAPEEPEDEPGEAAPVQDEATPPDEGEAEKQPERNTSETEALGAEDQDEVEPPAGVDGNTGETEVDPPADSTVVLRSVPIALYLERDGEAPVRVQAERFIIGRGPTCDLVIDSPSVSREHLAITCSGVRYFIEDLNSSNGTWFGEERVTKRELESGDVISLGNESVTFTLRAA
jgi:hypothetical protein